MTPFRRARAAKDRCAPSPDRATAQGTRLATRVPAALLSVACAWSCLSEAPPAATPASPAASVSSVDRPAPPPPRDDGRLPETVTPVHYDLTLRIDPSTPRFSGRTVI